MFSKKLFLSLLLIALIISVGCVNAVDSSNWKTVKVNDVDFKCGTVRTDCAAFFMKGKAGITNEIYRGFLG